jgi:hypothetical protein
MGVLNPLGNFLILAGFKTIDMKRSPIEVFSEWADLDKDYGMEKNHKESVENMLSFATKQQKPFSFIDAGCGNGWVVR